jgi:hypothetical protein
MRIALEDLPLDHLAVVYPGRQTYALSEKITVVPAESAVLGGMEALLLPGQRGRRRQGR